MEAWHHGSMTISFGADPVRVQVADLLHRIEAGDRIDSRSEYRHVDLKEEAGRRDKGGRVLAGSPENDAAAQKLASDAACMANTPGGGALIVGIADDGNLLGAALDAEWLRYRIYQLTQRLLTVEVSEAFARGVRLLVVQAPTAVEPVRMHGRIHWRVDDHCVEVDAATWHARRMRSLNYDWSADASARPVTAVRPQALAIVRDFLLASGEHGAEDLARSTDAQMLRRLNVVTDDGMLTNAGVLAFVGRDTPSLDYIHRDYAGGDSTARVKRSDRTVVEELSEVFQAIDAHNSTRHIHAGLVVRQVRDIPVIAAREAVVNGVAHREWGLQGPTVIEHIGRTLRVTSPGGFFGGVNESNIITHPSQSRNPALTQLLADLRIAEREGIGVDRMVREMIRLGHAPPVIREISGPYVRTSLEGDMIDETWMAWLSKIVPAEQSSDVSSLLILRRLVDVGWVDAQAGAQLVQLTAEEARSAILRLAKAELAGAPLLSDVEGVPEGKEAAWRISPPALAQLIDLAQAGGHPRTLPKRNEIARSYARGRGRISTTELGSLVSAHPTNVGAVLKGLLAEGLLEPSTKTGRGRGFFYVWSGPETALEQRDQLQR